MDVLRANSDALVAVDGQCLRVDGDLLLGFVGSSDNFVAADARSDEHQRADRPMILAVACVVFAGTLVVISIMGVLFALLLPAIVAVRESARRTS
jgi:uncharacterized protein (DUF983 family)